ncbi:MAG: hypothetical protein RQ842_09345 [Vulcanisaeta sp.]|nr:hypothetical protein [Vulcanisaeta sp.]
MPHKINMPTHVLEKRLYEHEDLVKRELEAYLDRKVLYWRLTYTTGSDNYPFIDPIIGPYYPVIRARVVGGVRDVALIKLRRVMTTLGIGYLGLLKQA